MFGFEKKKIQLRSVEDYLKTQEVLGESPSMKPFRRTPGLLKRAAGLPRLKRFAGPVLGILFIVILVGAGLSQFNGLRSEIAAIKAHKSEEVKELRLQLAGVSEKADKSEKRAAELLQEVSNLERALQAERAERMRAEQALRKMAMAAMNRARNNAGKATAKHFPKSSTRYGR